MNTSNLSYSIWAIFKNKNKIFLNKLKRNLNKKFNGPEISGKNILRLSSLTIIFFTYLTYLFVGKLKLSWSFNLVFF